MFSLPSLKKIPAGLESTLGGMRRALNGLNATIERLESDKTRSRTYVLEQVKAEREKVLPQLAAGLTSMREPAARAEAQRPFWSSKQLLLSRLPFDADPAVDAALRARYAAEYAAMDLPLLELAQRDALADRDLPRFWAAITAATKRGAPAASLPDLSQVEVPQQREALAAISACVAALAEAESIVAVATGMAIDPIRKLTYGRRMQLDRPTKHNSAGRVPLN